AAREGPCRRDGRPGSLQFLRISSIEWSKESPLPRPAGRASPNRTRYQAVYSSNHSGVTTQRSMERLQSDCKRRLVRIDAMGSKREDAKKGRRKDQNPAGVAEQGFLSQWLGSGHRIP